MVTEQELPKLPPGPNRDKAMALFKLFDTEATGKISIQDLKGATVKMGPIESRVLQNMRDMDYNDDGFVEEYEWEMYFATVVMSLTNDEFDAIVDDLSTAGSNMATVAMAYKLAKEGEADLGYGGDADDVEQIIAAASNALSEEQKQLVVQLFNDWDFNGDGHIDMSKLQTTGVEVGPRNEQVFADFDKMDIDKDGKVTLDEMILYFGTVSQMMTPEQFTDTVTEMSSVATIEKSIVLGVAMAGDAGDPVVAEGEVDSGPPPPLSTTRTALVEELFKTWSADLTVPIELSGVAAAKVDLGPAKVQVLDGLSIMDANSDGKLELGEMVDYFTMVSQSLSDSEFEDILNSLKDTAVVGESLKMGEAQNE